MSEPKKAAPPTPVPLHVLQAGVPRIDVEQVRPILPQLIDSLSDAVVVLDRNRRIAAANRRYMDAFGARMPDVVGGYCFHSINCPVAPENPADCEVADGDSACAACLAMDSGQALRQMRTVTDPNGVTRRWEATFSPVTGPSGEVTHVVAVWRDLSERSQLEAQLAHSERLASLGMLAAGVAHEINNPMAAILAGVERLGRWVQRAVGLEAQRRAEIQKILQGLEAEVLRCRETTEKLLLLAQPYRSTPLWVDLNRAVRDTLSLLNYQMTRQSVQSAEDLESGLPPILAREAGVRGICMNLALNAIQAMPKGGTLTLRTRRVGDRVRLEVEDTGAGIDPAILDRIWDPFFTTKPVGQGTGLGLSITRQVVQRYHGSIWVENRPGHGARFVVEIPIETPGGPLA